MAVIKSRKLRLAGHFLRSEENKVVKTVGKNKPEGRRPLEGQDYDGRIRY